MEGLHEQNDRWNHVRQLGCRCRARVVTTLSCPLASLFALVERRMIERRQKERERETCAMTGTIWTIWFQLGCERGNLILTDLLAITPFSLPLFSLSIAHLIVHSHHVYTATGQFVKDGRSATDCFFCFPFILSAPSTLRATGHGGLDCTADSQQLPLVCFEHWG